MPSDTRPMTPDELEDFERNKIHHEDRDDPLVPPTEEVDRPRKRDREPAVPPPPNPD